MVLLITVQPQMQLAICNLDIMNFVALVGLCEYDGHATCR